MKFVIGVLSLLLLLGSYSYSEAQELARYSSDVEITPSASQIAVTSEITIPLGELTEGSTTLFLNKKFKLHSIAGEHLIDYSVQPSARIPPWNEITLSFAPSLSEARSVTLSYSGSITSGPNDDKAQHGNFINANQVHLSIDSAWHPFFADFNTRMNGKAKIHLPNSWTVFAPGATAQNENTVTVTNIQPSFDLSFYAAQDPTTITSKHFTVAFDATSSTEAKTVLQAGERCLTQLNRRFGSSQPLAHGQAILLKRDGPSFARANYISLSSQAGNSKEAIYHYMCHELAHNWTTYGDVMSHDYWMVESFAEYVAALYIQDFFGDDALASIKRSWQQRAKGQTAVWNANNNNRASHRVNYGLGPLKLMALHQRIGDESFNALVHAYMTQSIIETEALLAQLQRLTDEKTRIWFEQQLAGD